MHIKMKAKYEFHFLFTQISILSVLLDLQHQKFHGQVKVYIGIQTSLGLVQSLDDFLDSFITKVFPGYVFVKMVMTDESWHLVRNVRGVTGFVGSGNKAVP
ncbi:transcription termination/antitermination factor NusG, partial [human gut metagenome]